MVQAACGLALPVLALPGLGAPPSRRLSLVRLSELDRAGALHMVFGHAFLAFEQSGVLLHYLFSPADRPVGIGLSGDQMGWRYLWRKFAVCFYIVAVIVFHYEDGQHGFPALGMTRRLTTSYCVSMWGG